MTEDRDTAPGSGRFGGQAVIVTGAAQGIGAACARRFASEGAAVTLADVDDPAGAALAGQLRGEGGRAQYHHCDVSRTADWAELLRAAMQAYGRLDVLHCNACKVADRPAHELPVEQWDRQLAVCLTGIFLGVKTCLEALQERGGSIVVSSSIHALFGFPGHPAYAAAKGGAVALARQLAVEYGPAVRVNTVIPGPILTRAWDDVGDAERDAVIRQTVAGRLGAPEEVAAAVAFLASADASFITGACLVVDGGYGIHLLEV